MTRRMTIIAAGVLFGATTMAAAAPQAPVPAGACDRVCLTGIADRYLAALVAHDPSKAPMAPNAKFLVISPIWPDAHPSGGILQARDILRAEAAAIGATFVDPIAEAWFWDRPDLIGADGKHPTNDGHVYMADRIAPVMAQLL